MWSLLRKTRGGSYPSTGGKVDVFLDESADAAILVFSYDRVAKNVRVEGIGFADLDKDGKCRRAGAARRTQSVGTARAPRARGPDAPQFRRRVARGSVAFCRASAGAARKRRDRGAADKAPFLAS